MKPFLVFAVFIALIGNAMACQCEDLDYAEIHANAFSAREGIDPAGIRVKSHKSSFAYELLPYILFEFTTAGTQTFKSCVYDCNNLGTRFVTRLEYTDAEGRTCSARVVSPALMAIDVWKKSENDEDFEVSSLYKIQKKSCKN